MGHVRIKIENVTPCDKNPFILKTFRTVKSKMGFLSARKVIALHRHFLIKQRSKGELSARSSY